MRGKLPPREPARAGRPRAASARALACLAALALTAASACGRRGTDEDAATTEGVQATAEWPDGALLLARRAPLEALLGELATLEGTPLAARAHAIASALPACELLAGRSAEGSLLEAARLAGCLEPDSPLAALERELGTRDLVFALPAGAHGRARGSLSRASGGGLLVELWLPPGAAAGARALLVPGSAPPGPTLLASRTALAHARAKPQGGLDLAALVPEGSQADQLFRLRSRLFAGAALDGSWEAALYPPAPGGAAPLAALALGAASARAAALGIDEFASELERSWPVHRTPFRVGNAAGACLLDLNLLPELAPCYVAREDALVIGWNPASLRLALAAVDGPGAAPDLGPEGGLVVHLDRLAESDAQLAAAAGFAAQAGLPRAWPWRRLRARGAPAGAELRVEIELEAGA